MRRGRTLQKIKIKTIQLPNGFFRMLPNEFLARKKLCYLHFFNTFVTKKREATISPPPNTHFFL